MGSSAPSSTILAVLGSPKEQADDPKKHRDPNCADDYPVAQLHALMVRPLHGPS